MQNHSCSVSRKHRRQAVVELSNHEVADETPKQKTMAERRDERPAKIVGPNYEETTIAQKPSVAEGNEERNGLTEQQNSENQTVKEWSKG